MWICDFTVSDSVFFILRLLETCAIGMASQAGVWYHDSQTDNCFFLSADEETWERAQAKCQSMVGANLATVAAIEQVFVTTLLSFHSVADDHTYIGLRLNATTGQHQWTDGSVVSSSNRPWEKDQPKPETDDGTEAACVTVNSRNGKWRSTDCSEKFRYLCLGRVKKMRNIENSSLILQTKHQCVWESKINRGMSLTGSHFDCIVTFLPRVKKTSNVNVVQRAQWIDYCVVPRLSVTLAPPP